jgi:DNA-binding FadR family transcriptional regulator
MLGEHDQLVQPSPDSDDLTRSEHLSKRIYRHFVESIKSGRFSPGVKLPAERQLMIDFSAPRTTVRRALKTLEEDGLVERRIGSGTFVRQGLVTSASTPSDGLPAVSPLDVLEARLALEPGLPDLVVARATSDDFERIEAALNHMRMMATEGSQTDFKKSGYRVNLEIVRATRNPLLIWIYEILIEARARAGWETLRQLNDTLALRHEQVEAVSEVVRALRDRDAYRARELGRKSKNRMIYLVAGFDTVTDPEF